MKLYHQARARGWTRHLRQRATIAERWIFENNFNIFIPSRRTYTFYISILCVFKGVLSLADIVSADIQEKSSAFLPTIILGFIIRFMNQICRKLCL